MRKHAHLWVGVGPVVVLLFAIVIFEWSAPAGSQLVPTIRPLLAEAAGSEAAGVLLDEARARYAWLTTVLLNLLVPIFAILCFAAIARRSLAHTQLRVAAGAVTVLCVGGIGLLFLSINSESALHRVVFDFTFDALRATQAFTPEFLNRVLILIRAINGLAVVAPLCALVAFVSTVVPRSDRVETVGDLRSRVRNLRDALNAAAALLVSGILHMSAWLGWSAALVGSKTAREGIELLTLSVTVFWGMAFTLMIVAGFVPAMMILRQRALVLYGKTSGETGDAEQWLTEHGFKFSAGHQLPQVAVMLAPLLAGPAASLFATLANWGQ